MRAQRFIWFYKVILVISECVNEQDRKPIYIDEFEQKAYQKYIQVGKLGITVY